MSENSEPEQTEQGDPLFAVPLPPAMCARDILEDPAVAEAMGYGWLHTEETVFAHSFRERVRRQAEMYQQWLDRE